MRQRADCRSIEGITIGGKTLREHNEVVGHGRATDRLETLGQRTLETADVPALHRGMMGGDSGDDVPEPGTFGLGGNCRGMIEDRDAGARQQLQSPRGSRPRSRKAITMRYLAT